MVVIQCIVILFEWGVEVSFVVRVFRHTPGCIPWFSCTALVRINRGFNKKKKEKRRSAAERS